MRRFLLGGLPALGLWLLPAIAAGQGSDCDLIQSDQIRPYASPDGTRIVYYVRPVFKCPNGAEIRADSAVMFEATSYSQFFRNVFMKDGTKLLQADTATYQDRIGRLNAQGRVRVTDSADGTNLAGDRLIYLRANPGRPEDIITVEGGAPTARFTPDPATDSTGVVIPGPRPRPVELTARWIRMTGNSLVQARGAAHLAQDSLDAFGDSLAFDQASGTLSLFRNARILAPQAEGDTMDLRGDTILVQMPGGDIEQLHSTGKARMLGTDVRILGPVIGLFFEDGEIARVVSTVAAVDSLALDEPLPVISPSLPIPGLVIDPDRPEVTAQDYRITGDSVEVLTPGGQVSNVYSAGEARAVSTARDSLNTPDTPEILLNDWIEGDSIRAFFEPDSLPEGEDAASEPEMQIRRLVATGNARSLSRFEPDSTQQTSGDTTGVLNVNYVGGSEIRIFLVDGEMDTMEVDEADGVFLQPAARARVMGDSASVVDTVIRPDTTSSPPDTTSPPPDTTHAPLPAQRPAR